MAEVRQGRTYALEAGVKDLLALALEYKLADHIETWKKQVDTGAITEETRTVFVAMGWITQRDVRVTPEARARQPMTKAVPEALPGTGVTDLKGKEK